MYIMKKKYVALILANICIPLIAHATPNIITLTAPTVAVQKNTNSSLVLATTTLPTQITPALPGSKFGTYLTPFLADSPWNVHPVAPVLGTFEIPKSDYFPAISSGAYSTGAFLAQDTDKAMIVYPKAGQQGVWNPDAEVFQPTVTIPHWPNSTVPATGSDGHADIIDVKAGIIHSFWQLKQVNGKWTTQLYSWMPLNGKGFADPAHYYQGGRAVGIPASAGIIRKHEVDDGKPVYEHALAMSLTFNALANNPTYVYPATSADGDAAQKNSGKIPEGALLMLPANYDSTKIASPALRKVVETLKKYGAYVVDRNYGTPFVIYVENGSMFKMSNLSWDNAVAAELDKMRGALRQVTSAKSWVDGNGLTTKSPLVAPTDLNILSMRGAWSKVSGEANASGAFDTMTQSLVFSKTEKTRTVLNNYSNRGLGGVVWAKRVPGSTQRLTVHSTGGAQLSMTVYSGGKVAYDSGIIYDKSSVRFIWPQDGVIKLTGISGIGQVSSVSAELVNVQ